MEALKKFPPAAAAVAQNEKAYAEALAEACDALAGQILQLRNTAGTADDRWTEQYYRTMRTFPD